MHGMDLSFNKHFHSLNKTVFAVGKKRSSVLPDKSSCPVYITGSCGNTENIGFRNYQYLAFIVRRQQEKVAGFYDRECDCWISQMLPVHRYLCTGFPFLQ